MHSTAEAEEKQQRWAGAELLVCAVIQLLLVNVAYRIDRMKEAPLLSTSSWAIFCGLLSGALLALVSEVHVQDAGLDPQILFLGLLPPIILDAGFNTQRKGFFLNFSAILLLAIIGTLVATLATGGILIWLVATLIVFQNLVESGNSDVQRHVAIIMVLRLLCIGVGSVALAGAICYSSAYFLRHSDPALRQHPTYEISMILLTCYGSYLAADIFQLSGLLAVFFSGVFIRHYHVHNISKASAFAFKQLLSTMVFLAENFIYLYLGLSVFAYQGSLVWDWSFIFANFGACLVARALNTFPLCFLANCKRSEQQKIPFKYMIVIWFSGLRGAIAFALVLNVSTANPVHAAILKSSTLFLVLFTTVFFGMATGPLLRVLGLTRIPRPAQRATIREDVYTVESTENQPLLSTSLSPPSSRSVHSRWIELDEKYLKPVFGGNPRPRNDTDQATYSSIEHESNAF
ncbi:unnamed protein product [Peronospora destructor]|uniref:Cation/H+ exchanger transmembrane domain-containing protein n=1 Tax=Peronospora destructor TaxID=86335 RepID=A0AAV0VDR9_9STRA|nr:unnamed protein product [Peronospora destructor]